MGDRDGVGVTETVPVGVSEPVAPIEGEEELEGGPVVDVGDTVLDPVHDRLPVGVGLGVRVDVKVAVGVKEGVTVLLRDAPKDIEGVLEGVGLGVWEGEGKRIPSTSKGPAYMVPALVTEFHTFEVKLPEVPVHTFMRVRLP